MISVRIMSECLRGLAGRDESHPAGSKALPLTNCSVWWQKTEHGNLSSMEPQQPSPRLRCVGHTWRCTLAVSGRKILFSPCLKGAAPPHVLCVVDARKDCRGPLIFGIPSRVKIASNSKIPLRNLCVWFWLLPKLQTEISHKPYSADPVPTREKTQQLSL